MHPDIKRPSTASPHSMPRRTFLQGAMVATALAGVGAASLTRARAAEGEPARDYYDLRTYRLNEPADRALLDTYLQEALIPALNRLGVKHVGAFTESGSEPVLSVHVLIPYPSIDLFATAVDRINADEDYLRAGEKYLSSPKSDPAFDRIDSWLLRAFAGIPRMELPGYCLERSERVFELRRYESHSESKALKKVEMFNAGEIQAMREAGLAPIFFGQAWVGSDLPHLTYLLSAENRKLHQEHWDAFGKHPVWQRLREDSRYADTVSKITNWFFVPTGYSQI